MQMNDRYAEAVIMFIPSFVYASKEAGPTRRRR